MNNNNFFGTIEFLRGQKAAIITITDSSGEWAGSSRIDGSNLYERGYARASQAAALKGGTLQTFKRAA